MKYVSKMTKDEIDQALEESREAIEHFLKFIENWELCSRIARGKYE